MRLSVIIPAYNEEKRLPGTLTDIDRYLSKQNYDYEMIVVSDGSRDKTIEVTKIAMRENKNLRFIEFTERKGKGFGVRAGLMGAKGDYRIFTDADNSTSIDQIEKMWPEFEKGYDIVIGSRDVKGAVLDPPQPLQRRFTGDVFKLYRKIVLGLWGFEDTQCGFKGMTKRAVDDILPQCKIDKFSFDPEILIIAQRMGYKIKEVPVNWKNDLESKVKLKSIMHMAIDLLKIKLNVIKGVYGKKENFKRV